MVKWLRSEMIKKRNWKLKNAWKLKSPDQKRLKMKLKAEKMVEKWNRDQKSLKNGTEILKTVEKCNQRWKMIERQY